MKASRLLLGGALIAGVVGLVAVVLWIVTPEGGRRGTLPLLGGAASMVILLAAVGLVVGWFGRDRDVVLIVVIGAGLAAVVAASVAALATGSGFSGAGVAAVIVLGTTAFGGAVAFVAWRIGDAICDLRNLPTYQRLAAPAFAVEFPGNVLWTTDAESALRSVRDHMASELGSSSEVDACSVGVLVGLRRERPAVVVLVRDRLAIQPVTLDGVPDGATLVIGPFELVSASIRSQLADGSSRRQIDAYDDVITVELSSGARHSLTLPYGSRGAGTEGGTDAIRGWIREHATTYV